MTFEQYLITEIITRTRNKHLITIQSFTQIVYFLQRLKMPIDYTFDAYCAELFCKDILYDLREMEVYSSNGYCACVDRKLEETPSLLLDRYKERVTKFSEQINKLIGFILPLNTYTLQSVRILDYYYRYILATNPKVPPVQEQVLAKFFLVRPEEKNFRDSVEELYSKMEKLNLWGYL